MNQFHRIFLLALIVMLACVPRVPVILCQLTGQDEDYYSSPGDSILKRGVPALSFVPNRDPISCFYHADEMLFALPPIYFYVQALAFKVFGASLGAARLVSLIAGAVWLIVIAWVGRCLGLPTRTVWWGVLLFGLSRFFFFPACFARLTFYVGLLAFLSLVPLITPSSFASQSADQNSARRASPMHPWQYLLSGALLGLALLTHPFALVVVPSACVLIMLHVHHAWSVSQADKSRRRSWIRGLLSAGLVWSGGVILTGSLWVPLLLQRPDLARIQIVNNLLNRPKHASDSLLPSRDPSGQASPGGAPPQSKPRDAEPVADQPAANADNVSGFAKLVGKYVQQGKTLHEHAGSIQLCLLLLGTLSACVRLCWFIASTSAQNRREPTTDPANVLNGAPLEQARFRFDFATVLVTLTLSILLRDHPAKGYWCLPAAFALLQVADLCQVVAMFCQRWLTSSLVTFIGSAGLILLLAPGSGWRASYHYARYPDRNDARLVYQQLRAKLIELPPDAWQPANQKQPRNASRLDQADQRLSPIKPRLAVDAGYVADFAREGWPTVLALDIPYYFKTSRRF